MFTDLCNKFKRKNSKKNVVQVTVSEGVLEGEVVVNEFGGQFCSFKGIPYAEPPLGDLRFKAPQAKKPWDGVRSAKEFGPVCYQFDVNRQCKVGSEDCLYLNVNTPELKPSTLLPVMVFIHGGGFGFGSGNDDFYGPEFLIKHDVIIVTMNYRVEALGFLCLDTEDIPGNAGMKDQVAALRWVKKNIKNFGGDSENITIFGESAGGASVGFHLVSPMSKGLFKRAIAQSGSVTCWWAQTFEPRERALKLAKQLGCNSEDDKELYELFKNAPLEKIALLKLPVTQNTKPYELSFSIASEKKFGDNERFFYGDMLDVFKNGIHEGIEVMTGYNEHEGLLCFGMGMTLNEAIALSNDYKEFLVPKPIQLNTPLTVQMEVGRKIKEHFFKKDIISVEHKDKLVAIMGWDMFVHGVLLMAKLSAKNNKTYLYKFTCKSERNLMARFLNVGEIVGTKTVVSHADDLFYFFPVKFANLKVKQNSETFKMIERACKLWTNFAKFGTPTPDDSLGAKWSPYTMENQQYLNIGNTLVAETAPETDDAVFWDAIYKQYLPSWVIQ